MALQVWLPLNGNLNNNGINNVTWSGAPGSWGTSGKIGKCATFAANTNTVITTASTDFYYTDNFSWCMWVYPTWSTGSQYAFTVGRADYGGYGYGLAFVDASTGRIRFGSQSWDVNAPSNQWTHIAFTKSGTSVKIYKNGVLTTDGTFTGTAPTYSDANGLCIGAFKYSGGTIYPYNGSINDFRLYSRALAPREIEILSRGLVCHYPLNGGGRGGDNIISGTSPNEVQYTYPSSSYSDKFSKKSTIVPSASQYVLSFWAKSTHAGDKVRAHWYSPNTTTKSETNQGSISTSIDGQIDFKLSDKWEKYWCVWTQSSTTAVKNFIFPRMFSQASGGATGTGTVSIKCVKLEEGNIPTPWMPNSADSAYTSMGYDSTTEYDVSGYGYNGTKNGTIGYSSDTARYNVCTEFSKAGYIANDLFGVNTSACTVNFWVKPKTASSQHFIFGTFNNWTGNGIGMYRETNDRYFKWLVKSSAESSFLQGSSIPTTLNIWNMITLVYTGTKIITYINGTKNNEHTYGSSGVVSNPIFYVANSKYNGTPASENEEAYISDVRFYATALSADDIKELYNTAVSVANNGTLMSYELVEV